MLDLDGAAAGEALRVLEHEARGGDRPGVDADVALDDDLGGGLLAGGHEGDGRGGEEGESELGHFDCLRREKSVGAPRVGCWSLFAARERLRGAPAAFLRPQQAGYGLQQARTAPRAPFFRVAASIGVLGAMRSRFCCARRYATLGATLFLLDRQARKCDPRDFQKAARGV